jgi:hypothetical protein
MTEYRNGQQVKYKNGVLEYDKNLGWCFLESGKKDCMVIYAYELKEVYRILKKI